MILASSPIAASAAAVHRPASAGEVATLIRDAIAEDRCLEIVGGGSKREIGRGVQPGSAILSLAALANVLEYEPAEMMLTVQAGVRLADIQALLRQHGQRLAFEPPDFEPLLEHGASQSTIGGVVAAGFSGPRRFKAGAVRDHVLAVQAVTGRGEAFRAGGKVVKNVTGFDLPKLLTGSWGTLAVLTEITLRSTPAPQTICTMLLGGFDIHSAALVLREAAGGPWDVTGAAWLPPSLTSIASLPGSLPGESVTALRLEGVAASVSARASALLSHIKHSGEVQKLEGDESDALWRWVGGGAPLHKPVELAVWCASVPPASGVQVLAQVLARSGDGRGLLDGAGGTIWLALPATAECADVVRAAVAGSGGQALLVRGPAAFRAQIPVFQPLPEPVAALTRRLKEQFDPHAILNRGRMYAGI